MVFSALFARLFRRRQATGLGATKAPSGGAPISGSGKAGGSPGDVVQARQAPGRMKIAVDAGHGMNNRGRGYDPGCEHYEGGQYFAEAAIALDWARELQAALYRAGIPCIMLRKSQHDSLPVWQRAGLAKFQGATHYISIHVNDAEADQANGTETLYVTPHKAFASRMQYALLSGLGLRDRGIKERKDLAVLKFDGGPAALLELGFIANDSDRAAFTNAGKRRQTCELIVKSLIEHG